MNKTLRYLLLMAAFVVPWATQAQVTSSTFRTGTDASRWITLSSNATTIVFNRNSDDGYSDVLNIGFSFYFGESTWSQFSVNTNGRMRLGPTAVGYTWSNTPFSSSGATINMPEIAPYAMDLSIYPSDGQYVKYELTGTAPHRILVIETRQSNSTSTDTSEKYQVQLYEDSSKLVLLYGANTGTMGNCQIGIASSASDILTVNTSTHTTSTGTTSATVSTWPGNGRYYEFVPAIPTCLMPAWVTLGTTPTTAMLQWTGSAASYTMEYAASSITPGASQGTVTSGIADTSRTLTGLSPNTTYYVYLHGNCGGSDTSRNISTSFTTPCEATGVPYAYGFETDDTLGTCWTYSRHGLSASSSYPNPAYTSSVYAGSQALYSAVSYNSDIAYWAAMPLLDAPMGDLLLSFYARKNYASSVAPLWIGYMTSADDYTTFVPLVSVLLTGITYEKYQVPLPEDLTYPAGARITFMFHNADGSSNNICLDNVLAKHKPTCPAASHVTASGISAGAATITWVADNSCSTVPASYTVVCTDAAGISRTVTTSGNLASFTGLEQGSEYTVSVTPSCGTGGYGLSDSVTFVTALLPCRSYSRIDTAEYNAGTATTNSYLIPSSYSNQFTEVLYTPADLGNDSMTITHFALQRDAANTDDITHLGDVDVYFANVSATSLSSSFVQQDASWTLVKHGLNFTGTGWVEFELDNTFDYDGSSNLLVAINTRMSTSVYSLYFYYNSVTGASRYVRSNYATYDPATVAGGYSSARKYNIRFIDKQCGTYSTCAAPAVTVDSVSDTAARLVWVPGYQETAWDVYYKLSGATAWRLAAGGTTATSTVLTGLRAGKNYDVKVMGLCEDSLSANASFTTACGPVYRNHLPFIDDFSNITTESNPMPACWSKNSTSYYPYVSSATVGGVSRSLYFYFSVHNSNAYSTAVLPEMQMGTDSLEITFDMYKDDASNSGTLIVGVMTDPAVDSTFVGVDTVTVADAGVWTEMYVDLHGYTGEGHYIALRDDAGCHVDATTNNNYLNVANVQVSRRSNCARPVRAYASNINHNAVDVNVMDTANVQGNSYIVYYGTENDIEAATDSVTFTGLSTRLTGLSYETDYYAWARVQCTEERSRTTAFSFTTLPPCTPVVDVTSTYDEATRTARISWNAATTGNAATAFVVRYKAMDDTLWNEDTVTDTYYQISNVLPHYIYDYNITTVCDTLVSAANSGAVSTLKDYNTLAADSMELGLAPLFGYYNYGYSQSLYTREEMATVGDTIKGLYYYNGTGNGFDANIDLYFGYTDDTAFASASAWLPADSLMRMDSGYAFNIAASEGWKYIPLAQPFVRDRSRNLVIAMDNNTGDYAYHYPVWNAIPTTANRTLLYYNDGTDPTPATPHEGELYASVPSIAFYAAPSRFDLAVTSNDTAMGTVTGGGVYDYGSEVLLSATAVYGCHFVNWSDGSVENPRSVTVKEDTAYTALFIANNTYYVSASSNDLTMGAVTGSGVYQEDSVATLTATARPGYHFVSWSDGATLTNYEVIVTGDSAFIATFAPNIYHLSVATADLSLGTVTGAGDYAYNTTATLTANPATGHHLVSWSDGNTETTRAELVLGDASYTATFAINVYAVSATGNDAVMGSVSGSGNYNHGTTVTLVATANTGYHFVSWSDGGTNATRIFTATAAVSLTATFAPNQYIFMVVSNNDATMGTVSGGGTYAYQTVATLTATAATGHHFVGWSDGSTATPRTVTVLGNAYYAATFAINSYVITVSSSNAAMGTALGGGSYNYGATATLTATANAGYHFVSWNDGNTNATRTVSVTAAATYTATFAASSYTLTVSSGNTAMGTVSGGGSYAYGATATLTATPATGHYFVSWNDGNASATRTVSVTGDASYTARFAISRYALTVSSNDAVMGSATGSGSYDYGTTATLTATANEGYHFVSWNDADANATRTVTVSADASYTATFAINSYTLTAVANDSAMGTVSGGGSYAYGATATLTATANEGYHFVSWNDGNTDATRTVTVSGTVSYTALFAINGYTLTVRSNDAAMGSVSGGGSYDYNATATLRAAANNGYHFVSWNDGNATATRTVTVSGDATYVGTFAINTYTITAVSDNEALGSVSGGGTYDYGTTANLTATSVGGTYFVCWSDGNTDNPRHVYVTGDATYTAKFDKVGINEADAFATLSIYPNPTAGQVTLTAETVTRVEVLDGVGRRVLTVNGQKTVDMSSLAAGVYTLRITLPEGTAVRKVVKR